MVPLLWKCGMCLIPFLGSQSGYSNLFNLTIQPEFFVGYREDSANWNIPGGNGQANILSELSWKDLKMFQIGGYCRAFGQGNLYLRGYGDYSWIYHGVNKDSDYKGDNRTYEYSRSINNAGKGETYDLSIGVGLQLVKAYGIFAAPVIGYAYSQQHLHMFEGMQVIYTENPEREGKEIVGLDSTYHNRWKGPFAGFDVMLKFGNFSIYTEWEYHWTHFFGKGNWNLRYDFYKDFLDHANGTGQRTNVCLFYKVMQGISVGLGVDYWDFHANDGKSEMMLPVTYCNSDGEPLYRTLELCEFGFNEVNWHSFRVNASVSLCF